ncbi:serine hydrolase [Rhodobacterales bacterium HKCCSP123]|nr:serine hydrolase [Rhodobacterales bacterium HKCCSP123]
MRLPFILPLLCVLSLAARADTPGPLAALAADVDRDAAQVIHVWTPEGAWTLATGPQRPGGRETRAGDRFILASVGKPYLSAALLRLHAAARLDIRDPVTRWLPTEVTDAFGGLEGVRIDHLLSMTSGVPDYLDDAFTEAWMAEPEGWTVRDALSFAEGEPPLFEPGDAYDYSNTNYLLAQLVLEAATGQSYGQALRSLVLDPVGAAETAAFGSAPRRAEDAAGITGDGWDASGLYVGEGFGDGRLIAPAAEVAAFFRALLVERRLLGSEALALMLEDPLGEGYGLGLDIGIDTSGYGPVYGHGGGDVGYSSGVIVLPEVPAVGVLLRGDENADEDLLWRALDLVIDGD